MQPRTAVPVRGVKQKQLFRIKTIPLVISLSSVLIWRNVRRNRPPLELFATFCQQQRRERERERGRQGLEGRVGTREVLALRYQRKQRKYRSSGSGGADEEAYALHFDELQEEGILISIEWESIMSNRPLNKKTSHFH